MRVADLSSVEFLPAYGIDMASIGTGAGVNGVAASYGSITPGRETTPHKHDEAEIFVVLRGIGEVVAEGRTYPVEAGSVIFFDPFDTHVLRNIGHEDLLFTDLYWRDGTLRASSAATNAIARLQGRPVFVFSTPPTPNGDLHLGHLSGPYLGADVYVRYLRSRGISAYHLTGSDDYQSYVVGRARQEESTPREVAARYAAEINATLEMMDIHLDQYTVTSADKTYAKGVQGFFSRLVNAGVELIHSPALFDGKTGAYLYEVDVVGNCPTCGEPSGGNICEQCGEPNTCVELVAPRSKLSDQQPRRRDIERYAIRLDEFKSAVEEHHKRAKVSPRLQELAQKVLSRNGFVLPITHPATWGVRPVEPTEDQQVIWVWPEMAYGFLHGIAELGRRLGKDWRANEPQPDWKIVHFFGFDNSFYHSILYPVLYHLAYPEWKCDIDYNENEFYLLDGLKFSTSRRHAIWGKDILTPNTVDAVRYYLAWTRGEHERTNFTLNDFKRFVDDILVKQWQGWLTDLGARINSDFGGRAPDAGVWTPRQTGYLNALEKKLITVADFYGSTCFGLNHVVEELNGLVKDASCFGASYSRIRHISALSDEYRTAIALELASARLLAHMAAPLMPRFAARLADALGGFQLDQWPAIVEFIVAGRRVTLANQKFFSSEATAHDTSPP